MVIECFGGIGCLRQTFALSSLSPVVSVPIGTNIEKARAVHIQWSGTIHWPDIHKVDAAKIRTLVPFAARLKWICMGGGFRAHNSAV